MNGSHPEKRVKSVGATLAINGGRTAHRTTVNSSRTRHTGGGFPRGVSEPRLFWGACGGLVSAAGCGAVAWECARVGVSREQWRAAGGGERWRRWRRRRRRRRGRRRTTVDRHRRPFTIRRFKIKINQYLNLWFSKYNQNYHFFFFIAIINMKNICVLLIKHYISALQIGHWYFWWKMVHRHVGSQKE